MARNNNRELDDGSVCCMYCRVCVCVMHFVMVAQKCEWAQWRYWHDMKMDIWWWKKVATIMMHRACTQCTMAQANTLTWSCTDRISRCSPADMATRPPRCGTRGGRGLAEGKKPAQLLMCVGGRPTYFLSHFCSLPFVCTEILMCQTVKFVFASNCMQIGFILHIQYACRGAKICFCWQEHQWRCYFLLVYIFLCCCKNNNNKKSYE